MIRVNREKLIHIFFISAFVFLSFAVRANDMNTNAEHIVWNKSPIQMTLPIGKERMITFPGQVSVQIADSGNSLTSDDIKLINNDGTLYITAKKEFPKTRLYIKTVTGINDKTGSASYGETILVDIQSSIPNSDNTPIIVINKQEKQSSTSSQPDDSVSLVSLNRFAIQSLYSPKRLIKTPTGIYRVPMHTKKTVHLIANDNVVAMPLASWRDDTLTVTAVLLRNIDNASVTLSPDLVLGQWASTVFYPRQKLTTKGTKDDSTTIFLTSSNNFNDALGGA